MIDVEHVHAIVVGPSPVEGAHVVAPSAAEVATLVAVREETGNDVALADPVTAIGDSLALLVVVLAIEEQFGIEVDDAVFDARRTPTVADVVREVERALAAQARRP